MFFLNYLCLLLGCRLFFVFLLHNVRKFKSHVDLYIYVARVSGIFTIAMPFIMEYPLILVPFLKKYKYVFYNLHHMQIPMYYALIIMYIYDNYLDL